MRPTTQVEMEDGEISKIDTWHPIDGEWVRLIQVFNKKGAKYYTGGILSGTADRDGPTEIIEQPREMQYPGD